MGQLGAHWRWRGDQHQIGAAGQGDVLHLVGEFRSKVSTMARFPVSCSKVRGVMNWVACSVRIHLHMAVLFDQGGGQGGGLIGGDAARDPRRTVFR